MQHMLKMIIASAIVLATTAITANAAELYASDISSVKTFFATLAVGMVVVQLPFGIALYTHTTYGQYNIAKRLHQCIGYILLFAFIFTAALCVANYNVDTYAFGIIVHITAGIAGAIVFPLKISLVRTYGGYVPKCVFYGSILTIVFLMLFVTTWI